MNSILRIVSMQVVLVFSLVSLFSFSLATIPVSAQSSPSDCRADRRELVLGLPKWYRYLDTEVDSSGRCSPVIEGFEDMPAIGIALLELMLRFSGILAVIMIFWGAFKFILSKGDPESAAGARKTVINAVVGLIIVIISTGVVNWIGTSLGA